MIFQMGNKIPLDNRLLTQIASLCIWIRLSSAFTQAELGADLENTQHQPVVTACKERFGGGSEMRFLRISLYFTIFVMLSGKLFAQAGATGTILGTVTDSSGAIVPDAKVTVTNTATNAEFRTTTSSAGDYNAPDLNPGPYKVTVQAAGFQK